MGTRRDFLKKSAYVAPAILTLSAVPAFASYGSKRMAKRKMAKKKVAKKKTRRRRAKK